MSPSLSTGKSEVDSKFPTDTASFLGLSPANIRFQSTGESEFVSLLLDGNKTVYPLIKDSTPSADSIKECGFRISISFSPALDSCFKYMCTYLNFNACAIMHGVA